MFSSAFHPASIVAGVIRPRLLVLVAVLLLTAGCVRQAEPAPAEVRTTLPPWSAPRDAISYIEAAGLEPLPLDITENQRTLTMSINVDGDPVEIPAFVGIDRVRALQAAVHTHDTSGTVWLEGKGSEQITLADFFAVWGVRFDDRCLGAACGTITVEVDGSPVEDPAAVVLAEVGDLEVAATTT